MEANHSRIAEIVTKTLAQGDKLVNLSSNATAPPLSTPTGQQVIITDNELVRVVTLSVALLLAVLLFSYLMLSPST